MKITKRHLRKVIEEVIQDDHKLTFNMSDIREFDKAVKYNKKMAASVMAPEEIEVYEDDAATLEMIRDMAVEQKFAGEPRGGIGLRELIQSVDTAVRDQIPVDIYYWIYPELK